MRLRTFESYWLLQNGLMYSYPMLQRSESCFVAVVGGGITGALISDALMEKGYEVLLIDKRDIAQGSTAATTSMLQYEIDTSLNDLSLKIGADAALMCYKAGVESVKAIGALVQERNIDCQFMHKNSLYFAHSNDAVPALYQEFVTRDKGNLGVSWLSADVVRERFGIECHGAILSDIAGSLDAYRFTHELIQYNSKRGMRVYDQTCIDKFDFAADGVRIITDHGHTVQCKKIIFCSGFESTKMVPQKIAKLFHTYACVSEPGVKVPEALYDTLVWDTASPYFYMRTTNDKRLLIGGEDSSYHLPFLQQAIKQHKGEKVQKRLHEIMPDVTFIEDFSWGGTFGSTQDGLPYIGQLAAFENAYFVLGFGGNGITFSFQGREIICDLLEGKPNQLAHHYRFGR